MIKKFNRGFTLIELLVVIAIIGILSSVVLASLNTARAKGADAAVKSNLNNMRAQAELYYDTNGNSYLSLCTTDPNFLKAKTAADAAGGGTNRCNSPASFWALSTAMKSQNLFGAASGTDYWCVDSSGASKLEDIALVTGTTDLATNGCQ